MKKSANNPFLFVLTIALLLIGVVITWQVKDTASKKDIRGRASEPIPTFNVTLNKYVVPAGGSYTATLSKSYYGKLTAEVYLCDLINKNTCSAKTTSAWPPDSTFVNGVATTKLSSNASLSIYHARFRIPSTLEWSKEIQVTVVSPNATEEYMKQKTLEAFNKIDSQYPLENQIATNPNNNGANTIAKVELTSASLSAVDEANQRAILFAGTGPSYTPPGPENSTAYISWRSNWSEYRKKLGAVHLMLADYYALREKSGKGGERNRQKIADHAYQALIQHDILSSLPAHGGPLAGIGNQPGNLLTLGDTGYTQRYLPDDAMGVFLGLKGLRTLGYLPSTYCSFYEKSRPLQSGESLSVDSHGKPCMRIDLNKRIGLVASAISMSVASRWMYTNSNEPRKQYGNDTEFWNIFNSTGNIYGYQVQPNAVAVRTDLSGRNMTTIAHTQSMNPTFYAWQMAGLSMTASTVLDTITLNNSDKQFYTDLLNFSSKAVAYELSQDVTNDYSVATKGLFNQSCDGQNATKQLDGTTIKDCLNGKKEYYTNFYNNSGVPLLLGDTWQHLGSVLSSLKWSNLPDDYNKTKVYKKLTFLNTVWNNGNSFIDFSRNSFNAELLSHLYPNSVCVCGAVTPSCSFIKETSSNTSMTISSRMEFAQDYLFSVEGPYYHIMRLTGDSDAALEMLEYTRRTFDGVLANPPNPRMSRCNTNGGAFAGGNVDAGQILRLGAFIYQTAFAAWYRL
jgi:hypothetical protein